jgi:hypothetical protein
MPVRKFCVKPPPGKGLKRQCCGKGVQGAHPLYVMIKPN